MTHGVACGMQHINCRQEICFLFFVPVRLACSMLLGCIQQCIFFMCYAHYFVIIFCLQVVASDCWYCYVLRMDVGHVLRRALEF